MYKGCEMYFFNMCKHWCGSIWAIHFHHCLLVLFLLTEVFHNSLAQLCSHELDTMAYYVTFSSERVYRIGSYNPSKIWLIYYTPSTTMEGTGFTVVDWYQKLKIPAKSFSKMLLAGEERSFLWKSLGTYKFLKKIMWHYSQKKIMWHYSPGVLLVQYYLQLKTCKRQWHSC